MTTPGEPALRRRLGLFDTVTLGLGSMIGAGIFVALAPAAAAAGTGLLVGLAIAGVVATCNAMSSAWLAARYPQSGGTYVYGRERLGPFWGHTAGWSFVVGKTASCAAMALTVGYYVWPQYAHAVAVAAVVALTAVGYAGVQRSALLTRIIVAAVLAVLALVVTVLLGFGGEYFNYSFLAEPFRILGNPYGLNRVVAFLAAVAIAGGLWLFLGFTRTGTAVRAVAVAPEAAGLVAIDVPRFSAFAFALGGAVTAAGGTLLSTFYTFNASMGVVFTMKALIIVIMGGVGDVRGAVLAALILGLAETAVASLIDPGLTLAATYALFILTLLFRPQGLFGRAPS